MQKTSFIIFLYLAIFNISSLHAQSNSSVFVVRNNDDAQMEEKIKRDLQSQKSKKVEANQQNHGSPTWNYILNAPEPSNAMEKRWNKSIQQRSNSNKPGHSQIFPPPVNERASNGFLGPTP